LTDLMEFFRWGSYRSANYRIGGPDFLWV